MNMLKKPSLYIVLLILVSLILAYTTYHYASQSSKQLEQTQQTADSRFLSQLDGMQKALQNAGSASPDTDSITQIQQYAAKLSALTPFTSYYEKQNYVESVTNRLDEMFTNYGLSGSPLDSAQVQEWITALQVLREDPSDMEGLNQMATLISAQQASK